MQKSRSVVLNLFAEGR